MGLLGLKDYRITLEGWYVRDERAETPAEAQRQAFYAYRAKYGRDGQITRCVEVKR